MVVGCYYFYLFIFNMSICNCNLFDLKSIIQLNIQAKNYNITIFKN